MNRFYQCYLKNRPNSKLCKLYNSLYIAGNGLNMISKGYNVLKLKQVIDYVKKMK